MNRTEFLNKKKEIKNIDFAFDQVFKQLNFEVPSAKSEISKEDLDFIYSQTAANKSFIENSVKKAISSLANEKTTIEKIIEFEGKKYKIGIFHVLEEQTLAMEITFCIMGEYLNIITHTFSFDLDKVSMDHDIKAERKRPSLLDAIRHSPSPTMPGIPEMPLGGIWPDTRWEFDRNWIDDDRSFEIRQDSTNQHVNIYATPNDWSLPMHTGVTHAQTYTGVTHTQTEYMSNIINEISYSSSTPVMDYSFTARATSISLEP